MFLRLTIAVLLMMSLSSYAKVDHSILLFASGGYTSCNNGGPTGIGMYSQVSSLISKTQKTYSQLHWVINCLTSDAPPSGQGRYISSDHPKTVQYADADDFVDLIRERTKDDPDMEVVLVGHSYGGWMVMYMAENLAKDVKLAGLYTLDPISPKTCGPWGVITGAAGCHQAPKDLDNRYIAENAGLWMNFFQTQDSWLTSSAIPEANENLKVTYRGPHTTIDSDNRVWQKIAAAFKE